jgi:hypothetical protein
VGNDGEASRRAAKALKTERSSNSGPGRELRVTVGVEDLSQRIAATQLAATQRMARSPSGTFVRGNQQPPPPRPSHPCRAHIACGPYIGRAGSSPDVRLVGVAGLDGPPERGGSTLIVSVGDRLLALCPSLAEKALQQQQQQHAQPREAAGASHVPVLSLLSVLLSCLVSPFLDGAALSKLCCICGGGGCRGAPT